MNIDEYAREGCTRVEGAFLDWVHPLTTALDRINAAFDAGETPIPAQPSPVQNPPSRHLTGQGGIQLRNCMPLDPIFADWARTSPAAALVGTLMQADHTALWMDASFIKQGRDPDAATPWHNDVCTFPFTGNHLPSLWIALTDVAEDNAPMLTLTGSNHDPHRYHSPLSRQDITLPGYRPWSELEARTAAPNAPIRTWPARAGDALLIHPKTIHASLPRTTTHPGRRIAFTTRWIGSDVIWNPDALSAPIPHLASRLTPGAPPPESLFPILWQKQPPAAGAAGPRPHISG
ncbi:phytanoyl-CoA dioxygenase family protein [Polymorphobacter sp.]|uniref:phytanoyl-CoA dioxygenase family protein n=1 Tax=Polymorphobacter sp. TaxID=1909290 RepID=UPI003F70C24A